MIRFFKNWSAVIVAVFTVLLASLSCIRKTGREATPETLARIGDRVLTVDEFMRRAEYTIRPPYCRQNTAIDKKIVLNSLIAEKMLAMESGENDPLRQSEIFQAFVRGRKEQAMRQWFFHEQAYQKVKLDEQETAGVFNLAGRKYKVKYFNVRDSALAAEIRQKLDASDTLSLAHVYESLGGRDQIPEREVKFDLEEDRLIEDALYRQPVRKGQIIGPIRFDKDQHFFMQVDGWTDTRVVSDQDIARRWQDVRERLTKREAEVIWGRYVARVMKGKKVEFNPDIFYKMVDIMAAKYLYSEQQKKDAFNEQFWDKKPDLTDQEQILSALSEEEKILDSPFYILDGRTWTVRDFRTTLLSHPLVFRDRKFSRSEFPEQLKLAIVDMIADQHITEEAYKKKMDRVPAVVQNARMWEDAVLAGYVRQKRLKEAGVEEEFTKTPLTLLSRHLNAYVDSLQQVYSDRIEINISAFDKIELTRIDMFVTQDNVPYPIIVPSFPVLTSEHRLDYGKVMEK
ncbi:hypothetical protein JW906_09115 [bacterium]|nr:hypothetical protein [bacterium]